MRNELNLAIIPILLAAAGVILGQSKPIEEMSRAERRAYLKAQKVAPLNQLPGVKVAAIVGVAPTKQTVTVPDGWTERLQLAVELRLRQNGIRVLSGEEYKTTLGRPSLSCSVMYNGRGASFAASTSVILDEDFVSIRTSRIHRLPSWENTLPWDTEVEEPTFEHARALLFEAVDEFCNDYLAANSKTMP